MNDQLLNNLIDEIESKGWSHITQFFSKEFCQNLIQNGMSYLEFERANVGKEASKNLDLTIRDSYTCWIDEWSKSAELTEYDQLLQQLGKSFNQAFFLSIKNYESQFALYKNGGFYKKHLDQHSKSKSRKISVILYLNDVMQGGELLIFNKNNPNEIDLCLLPNAGDIIVFSSADIYHEVLPVVDERISITTWLRDD